MPQPEDHVDVTLVTPSEPAAEGSVILVLTTQGPTDPSAASIKRSWNPNPPTGTHPAVLTIRSISGTSNGRQLDARVHLKLFVQEVTDVSEKGDPRPTDGQPVPPAAKPRIWQFDDKDLIELAIDGSYGYDKLTLAVGFPNGTEWPIKVLAGQQVIMTGKLDTTSIEATLV